MCNVYETTVQFGAEAENESFARVVVAGFMARVNPTLEELTDVRMAVSEAVTNSIIHGYSMKEGTIRLICRLEGNELEVIVEDEGIGIDDVKEERKRAVP